MMADGEILSEAKDDTRCAQDDTHQAEDDICCAWDDSVEYCNDGGQCRSTHQYSKLCWITY